MFVLIGLWVTYITLSILDATGGATSESSGGLAAGPTGPAAGSSA